MASYHVSVTAVVHEAIARAAKERGVRMCDIVHDALQRELGLDPRRPKTVWRRKHSSVSLTGYSYRAIRRHAERSGRSIGSVTDELIRAALDREGAA